MDEIFSNNLQRKGFFAKKNNSFIKKQLIFENEKYGK
jgi:hypothetical protein